VSGTVLEHMSIIFVPELNDFVKKDIPTRVNGQFQVYFRLKSLIVAGVCFEKSVYNITDFSYKSIHPYSLGMVQN
jgi:hypothetical protein